MFIKMDIYKSKKIDFHAWKEINKAAKKIYEEYGKMDVEILLSKTGRFIQITELNRYKSKVDFRKIMNKVNDDKRVADLFNKFLKLIYKKKFIENEFEAVL